MNFSSQAARGRALAGALAALGVATLAGCGGGGGSFGTNTSTPAVPALNGQAIQNPFGLNGQAFSVVLHPAAVGPLRSRAVSGTSIQISKTFDNLGGVPATDNLNDISTLLTLGRVTLTLPAGNTVLPSTITVNSLSADIQVMDVGAQSGQTFTAALPNPVTLTLQPDNSYAPAAGTSLQLTDVIPLAQALQLATILTSGAQNSVTVTLNANLSPDLPDGTQFNGVVIGSQLQADVTAKPTGGGGGNPAPGNAGLFGVTLANSQPADPTYNGTAIPSTPTAVNFGFNTSVDNAASAHVLNGTGTDVTGTRTVEIRINNPSFTLSSGEIFNVGAGAPAAVTYKEGATKVWTASAGSVSIDGPSPLTATGDLVTVANAAGGVGGATMVPDTSVAGNTAQGTFTLRVTNPSSP